MSNTAYRSDEIILQARRHELLEKRWAARADVESLLGLQAGQSARVLAGAVGAIVTAVGLGAYLVAHGIDGWSGRRLISINPPSANGLLTLAVFAVPALTALVVTSGRTLRMLSLRASLKRLFAPTSDLRADVARLESASDLVALRDRLLDRAGSSFALPFTVFALFAPLMLHFVVFSCFSFFKSGGPHDLGMIDSFDQWVVMSCGLMALSYLVLIVRVHGFAGRARSIATQELARFGSGYGFGTLGLTSLAACVPGAVLFFIPPVVSFVTGLALLPAMFAAYGALIRRERRNIEAAFENAA